MSKTRQFCTFHLENLFLGVEVDQVQEVMLYDQMTEVPLTDSAVAGLINLRGQIVTALDLRRCFAMPIKPLPLEDPTVDPPKNVVVKDGDEAISLLVDEIGDVLEIDVSTFEPPPPTLTDPARQLVRGIHKLDGQLLLVLDVERALHTHDAAIAMS